LSRPTFHRAHLLLINLKGTGLVAANLHETSLQKANLAGLKVKQLLLPNFQNAYLWEANLCGTDLSSSSV
jgi:uncharacterized protein YjbI with pentapeptide repeats